MQSREALLVGLNEIQKQVITQTYATNTLVIAGPGSGKTSCLTKRMAFILASGYNPEALLTVTFTNKAAEELKSRLHRLVGEVANHIMVGTFHSICLKLLRMFGSYIGYSTKFRVIGTDDSNKVVDDIIKYIKGYSDKESVRMHRDYISSLKNRMISPSTFESYILSNPESNPVKHNNAKLGALIYAKYDQYMKEHNMMDFDDLISNTIELLKIPAVSEYCHNRFKYICCDESQDTNTAQFHLLKLIAGNNNILLVSDDSQSIYSWRGGKVENLRNFLASYEGSQTIMMTQNYRSTQNIVEACNKLIKHNTDRFDKTCVTTNPMGHPVYIHGCSNTYDEVEFVINQIKALRTQGHSYSDMAILYRINSISAFYEKALIANNIPYSIIKSTGFYQRMEIKGIIAMLHACVYCDDISIKHYLKGIPTIGEGTVDSLQDLANIHKANIIDIYNLYNGRNKNTVIEYLNIIKNMNKVYPSMNVLNAVNSLLNLTGYMARYKKANSGSNVNRLNNITTLMDIISEYTVNNSNATLHDYLDEIAIMTVSEEASNPDSIKLMTAHASKGLEFPIVFIVSADEDIFPHIKLDSDTETKAHYEEERRLFYVAMSRAMKLLYITHTNKRMINSIWKAFPPSRFLSELPKEHIYRV